MSQTTQVTDEGQTTIPQQIRKKYGIGPGDEVVWKETERGIVFTKRASDDGRGMLAEGFTDAEREALATELTTDIREQQRAEWTGE